MASLPPRQQPQRRTSPEQTPNDQSQSQATANSSPARARSAHSEDSQTLFLNSPKHDSPQQQTPNQQQSPQASQQPGNDDNDSEPKKCWICFADSTEDGPESSPWVNPCPCALVAHESCLLEWIADIELPTRSRSRSSLTGPQIQCPQCKSEIKLSRPRDVVVEAVKVLQRATAHFMTPGALTLLAGTLYNQSMLFGVHSIYAVFGSADGVRILRPLLYNIVRSPVEFNGASASQVGRRALRVFLDHMVHWRLYVGVPLIGPMLVLSRSQFADSILPVLPVVFFATQAHSREDILEAGIWPPSASLAFAVLPYVRQAYNSAYNRLFAEREMQWLREVQPRLGRGQGDEAGDGEGANPDRALEDRDEDNVFEVRIDGGIWEEWEDEADIPQGQAAGQNAPQQQPQEPQPADQRPDAQADPPPNIVDNRANEEQPQQPAPAPAQPQQPPAEQQRRLSFSPTTIAQSVLGALLFPSIASFSGELLKLVLPLSWTAATYTQAPGLFAPRGVLQKGLLKEKWGRSLVGGCLFVVVKDAMMLYVRWKMARIQRARRVVEYQGEGRR